MAGPVLARAAGHDVRIGLEDTATFRAGSRRDNAELVATAGRFQCCAAG
ncbi:3-keto-5-aminohexanoate cleavage protein [Terrabacter sp. BE26]